MPSGPPLPPIAYTHTGWRTPTPPARREQRVQRLEGRPVDAARRVARPARLRQQVDLALQQRCGTETRRM